MNTNLILKRPVHVALESRREKESVRRLLTFERFARDNQLWDEMLTCYLPDATVQASWFKGSAKEFADALAKDEWAVELIFDQSSGSSDDLVLCGFRLMAAYKGDTARTNAEALLQKVNTMLAGQEAKFTHEAVHAEMIEL